MRRRIVSGEWRTVSAYWCTGRGIPQGCHKVAGGRRPPEASEEENDPGRGRRSLMPRSPSGTPAGCEPLGRSTGGVVPCGRDSTAGYLLATLAGCSEAGRRPADGLAVSLRREGGDSVAGQQVPAAIHPTLPTENVEEPLYGGRGLKPANPDCRLARRRIAPRLYGGRGLKRRKRTHRLRPRTDRPSSLRGARIETG